MVPACQLKPDDELVVAVATSNYSEVESKTKYNQNTMAWLWFIKGAKTHNCNLYLYPNERQGSCIQNVSRQKANCIKTTNLATFFGRS